MSGELRCAEQIDKHARNPEGNFAVDFLQIQQSHPPAQPFIAARCI
jgi:hypothetical protein